MVDMYASVDDRIVFYKTLNCHKMFVHDWSACPYKHKGEKARRRCLLEYSYNGKICPEMKEHGECSKGDQCDMTHSMFEYWMHPQKYRTTMCKDGPGCKRPFCFFAHIDQELRDPEDLPELLKEPTTTLPPETLSNLPPGTLTGSGTGLSAAAIAAGQALPSALAVIAARAAVSPARTPRTSSPCAPGAGVMSSGLTYGQQQVIAAPSSALSDCSTTTTCSGNLIGAQQLMAGAGDAADGLAFHQGNFPSALIYNGSPMAAAENMAPEMLLPLSSQALVAAGLGGAAGTHEAMFTPPAAATSGNQAEVARRIIEQQQQQLQQLQLQLQLHLQQQQLQLQLHLQQQQQAAAAGAATAAALASSESGGLMQQLQQLGLDGQEVLSAAHGSLSSPQCRQLQEQQQMQQQMMAGAAGFLPSLPPGMTFRLAGAAQSTASSVAAMTHQSLLPSSDPFLLRSISLPQAPAAITAPTSPVENVPAAGLSSNTLATMPAHATAAMALGGCMAASLASYPGVKAPEPRLFELF